MVRNYFTRRGVLRGTASGLGLLGVGASAPAAAQASADPQAGVDWSVDTVELTGTGSRVLSFGEDPDGELYVCTAGEQGGAVHRLSGTE